MLNLMRSAGRGLRGLTTVLIILGAINFVQSTDPRRLRLWFRTYDEHGNLSADTYTLEADDDNAVGPRTETLDYTATGIQYWMEGGGNIVLRTTNPGPDGRATVATYNRPTIGPVTVGNLRFNQIIFGAAAEGECMSF